MAAPTSTLVAAPTFTGNVSTTVQLEPLQGAERPPAWLQNFPEAIYNQSQNSLLYQFLFTLLGPTGVGFLRDNLLQARLVYEEANMTTDQIEDFYGNPFGFSRSIEEFPEGEVNGLLTQEQLAIIETQNSRYQNRAIDFFHGIRFGNNPRGLKLIAKSGLGQNCEIAEQYKYLWDQKSDNPIGFPNYGQTTSIQEFAILASNEISPTQVQTINISNGPTLSATFSSSTAVTAGTYYWQIQAVDALGNSSIPSNEVSMIVTNKAVTLTWQPVQNAVEYQVYRATISGGETIPGSNLVTTTSSTTYIDTITSTTTGYALEQDFQLYFNGNYMPQPYGVANAWEPDTNLNYSLNPNYSIVATISTNVNISDPGTDVFNGITVSSGQIIHLTGQTTSSQNGFYTFNGSSSTMTAATRIFADQFTVQSQLQALTGVGNNVRVTGGPSIINGLLIIEPYTLTFNNIFSNQSLNLIQVNETTFFENTFLISASIGSISGQEVLDIAPVDFYNLQTVMDRVRSIISIPNLHIFTSVWNKQAWQNIYSTTQRTPVIKYTTGRSDISWPTVDNLHWIIGGVETEALRVETDIQHDYQSFHQAAAIVGSSNHVGPYNTITQTLYPNLTVPTLQYQSNAAYATNPNLDNNYFTQVEIDSTTGKPIGLIDGSYPYDYFSLLGINLNTSNPAWWSSLELTEGSEALIFDLGSIQAVNYLEFETTYKPYTIEIQYDIANYLDSTNYYPVVADTSYNFNDTMMAQFNMAVPWTKLDFYFNNGVDPIIFTRFIKLIFTRGLAPTSFGNFGWSIDIRNLRVGRVVSV